MRKRATKTETVSNLGSSEAKLLRSDSLPRVFLNHFYVVLDSQTYKAIEQDTLLRQHFAVNEIRTTVRADLTYTGLYFYGVNTYFEFFDAANSPRPKVGDSGIAFGVDQSGEMRVLQERLGTELETYPETVTRLFKDKPVPWFFMATPRSISYASSMSCWLMEYHPEFLTNWNPTSNRRNQGMSRGEVLSRYSEVLNPKKTTYLQDVVGLTIAVDSDIRDNLAQFCSGLGFRENREKDVVVLSGTDFALRLVPSHKGARGLREIRMTLGIRAFNAKEFVMRHSVLKLKGFEAAWLFL